MIGVVVGTRPEIMKMAPVVWELERRGIEFKLVHTGQHYDFNMSKVFFDELEFRKPDAFLEVGSGSREEQLKAVERRLGKFIRDNKITLVCVQGDTNSVLGAARAAKENSCTLAHVESGARSFVKSMPEEKNRVETDGLSDVLFAPTENCARNLKREGIVKNVFLSGNTEVDTLGFGLRKKRPPGFAGKLPEKFFLLTFHRQENATPARIRKLWKFLGALEKPVVFLVHPRTQKVLETSGLAESSPENVLLEKPVGYFELLWLLEKSEAVLTDSGGVQVEAVALGKPLLILRKETEWVEVLRGKAGVLLDLDEKGVSKAERFLREFKPRAGVFKGNAGSFIVSKLAGLEKGLQ
ncbi:MAG: UDP-N-acetylglucosamine 2-epimerase (non-hydrolyzing) [Candidatus Micrarchaeota archaeon]